VVAVTDDLRVQVKVWQGDDAVLKVTEHIEGLAARYAIREVAYDPWRFRSEALRLEERGLQMVEWPQSSSRMAPASERLYAAIVEKRLRHPNDPDLNRHVAATVARETPRGWRIDKATDADQNDAAVALAMAVDAVENRPAPVEFLGWL
jgi:phage terminase large subunit-like protein